MKRESWRSQRGRWRVAIPRFVQLIMIQAGNTSLRWVPYFLIDRHRLSLAYSAKILALPHPARSSTGRTLKDARAHG